MDPYRELRELLANIGGGKATNLYQGVVTDLSDVTCEVSIDGLSIPDVRLRASTEVDGAQIIMRPAVGSVVIVGSLTGDLDHLVVLSMDRAEEVIINGGSLGGIVKVQELTQKLNALESEVNNLKQLFASWVPVKGDGGAVLRGLLGSWAGKRLTLSRREDYEDTKVKH
ncbi:MAG: hypothetical protein HXN06_06770 [Porphyromonadaceae bacterium]|nr:hypothetical protein [Porphyromonadaceae bacterium]